MLVRSTHYEACTAKLGIKTDGRNQVPLVYYVINLRDMSQFGKEVLVMDDVGKGLGTGFFMGVAAGLIIGFLYAPKPGAETRQGLRSELEEVEARAKNVIDRVRAATHREKTGSEEGLKEPTGQI